MDPSAAPGEWQVPDGHFAFEGAIHHYTIDNQLSK
jgi:hypothetical protein